MTDFADDLALALHLADLADPVSSARYQALDLAVEQKPDLTPVTDADRAVEQALRDALAAERPDDAVVGEEYGTSGSGSRRWVIDPIDGTKNFVRGVPVWATLIALMIDDEPVVGVVSAPALGRRWWAARGAGAWVQFGAGEPRRCQVSAVSSLDDASLSYSNLAGWGPRLEQLLSLERTVWRSRAFGDFWAHMLLAEGGVDISTEPEVSLWDLAAVAVIVTEAGGVFTDLAGRPGPAGGSALAANPLLHAAALAELTPGTHAS